jgi:hypothetical protein
MVLLTLFFALKTDIVYFNADKIFGGNFQILGENFPPEMPRINTAFWTLKSGGGPSPHSKKWGGGPVPPRPPPGNYAYVHRLPTLSLSGFFPRADNIIAAFRRAPRYFGNLRPRNVYVTGICGPGLCMSRFFD